MNLKIYESPYTIMTVTWFISIIVFTYVMWQTQVDNIQYFISIANFVCQSCVTFCLICDYPFSMMIETRKPEYIYYFTNDCNVSFQLHKCVITCDLAAITWIEFVWKLTYLENIYYHLLTNNVLKCKFYISLLDKRSTTCYAGYDDMCNHSLFICKKW